MVTTAKTVSQIAVHMGIGFAIAWGLTGSLVVSGLAVLLEPLINVGLLPLHEKAWAALRRRRRMAGYAAAAAQKISQTAMHMAVAFGVIYWATGSIAFGGLAAVLEPVCNVMLLPFHDRAWERVRARVAASGGRSFVAA
jgi:uncharacterized membrane protein